MDHITFQCDALPGQPTLIGFTGEESISAAYTFEVFVRVDALDDLDGVLGARGTLTMSPGDGAEDQLRSGVVRDVVLIEQGADHSLLRITLCPRLALLALSVHSRIFTDVTVPEVLQKIFALNQITDYDLRLGESYPVEAHVCQYKESDLAFVERWMEREGIHYWFEHEASGERLIVSDAPSTHEALGAAPAPYRPGSGGNALETRGFFGFRSRRRSAPGKMVLRDYDYAKPDLDVMGEAPARPCQLEEVVVHGARFFTPDDGARLARVRAEEVMVGQALFSGQGAVWRLGAGHTFELTEHPISAFNTSYLCTRLRQRANLGARTGPIAALLGVGVEEVYRVDVVAIEATRPYRPARRAPWPHVHGFEVAVVDGPVESEYAQLDDDGRYLVRVHFDEATAEAGQASTRIRMMQPHAGNPEGIHLPLRKGTEVLLGFLGGDPDRPFVAGAVPNALNPSPVTAKNHTRNIIHTGSDNHFELEDQLGKQWIDLRVVPENTFEHLGTPHDGDSHYIVLNTRADCLFDIGGDQDIFVGGELHETVQGAVKETYHATQTTKIHGPQTTTVTAGVTEKYQALQMTVTAKQVTEEYTTGQSTTVSNGPRTEIFVGDQQTSVSGGLSQFQWTGTHIRSVGGNTQNTFNGTLGVHATSNVVDIVGGDLTQIWGPNQAKFASLNLNIGGDTTIVCPSFDLHVPFWNWAGLSAKWTTGLAFNVIGLSISNYWASLSRRLVSISDQAASISLTGPSLTLNGLSISIVGFGDVSASTFVSKPSFLLCVP